MAIPAGFFDPTKAYSARDAASERGTRKEEAAREALENMAWQEHKTKKAA
jgi:hypothetical protein